jgi:hypothetical protein
MSSLALFSSAYNQLKQSSKIASKVLEPVDSRIDRLFGINNILNDEQRLLKNGWRIDSFNDYKVYFDEKGKAFPAEHFPLNYIHYYQNAR